MICRAYNTHYEISEYNLGDVPRLEKHFSRWDPIIPRYIPYYYYDNERQVLYIPRGCDSNFIANVTGKPVTFVKKSKPKRKFIFTVGNLPRDNYQRKMIRFLVGEKEFTGLKGASQQVLSLPTRSGKTYITIASIAILEVRALIIVNSDDLRTQWRDEIIKHTQLQESNVMMIKGSEQIHRFSKGMDLAKYKDTYIFITTHRTLQNVVTGYGGQVLTDALEKLQIGIKVIDEAHIEFMNTLITDYFTDVWKTWYLTATFARSDSDENKIFQRAFDKVNKIAMVNPERKPSVILFMIGFCTSPTYFQNQEICFRKRGFDRYAYIDYELNESDKLDLEISNILRLVIETKRLEGKILILASSIEACEHFERLVKDIYPSYSVCCHTSKNKIEDFREYGVICSTRQMLGTAMTIPKLRVIINTEPSSSNVNPIQTIGRLDVYEGGLDTYYFYVMDIAFSKVHNMFTKLAELLKSVVKQVVVRDDTVKF